MFNDFTFEYLKCAFEIVKDKFCVSPAWHRSREHNGRPQLYLRHDVDVSVKRALMMAEFEADCGVMCDVHVYPKFATLRSSRLSRHIDGGLIYSVMKSHCILMSMVGAEKWEQISRMCMTRLKRLSENLGNNRRPCAVGFVSSPDAAVYRGRPDGLRPNKRIRRRVDGMLHFRLKGSVAKWRSSPAVACDSRACSSIANSSYMVRT